MLVGPKLAGMTITVSGDDADPWMVEVPSGGKKEHLVLFKRRIPLDIALAREVSLSNHHASVQALTSIRAMQRMAL